MAKKLPDTDLGNLPVCAAEFIRRVIKKMRYRKKVRVDVAAELTAHFEDELKECTTDEEKEQKAQRLVAEFGDVKLLGVLLRRAKKRCQPMWRTVVARGFQTAGVLILCLIIYIVWFLTGKPAITTNYVEELNRMVRPAADESLNAAPLYVEAAELVEKLPDETKELLSKKYYEATSEEKQIMEKWLFDNKDILDLVITGSKKPYYWQEYGDGKNNDEMMAVLMPNLAGFRSLARALLRWRVWISAEGGRYGDALDDIKAGFRFGQQLKENGTFIEQLIGIAIRAIAVQELRGIASQYRIDSVELAAFQKDFEQMVADEDFVINLDSERLSMYDEIQRCFTEDRFGGGHLCLEGLKRVQILEGVSKVYYDDGDVIQSLLTSSLHILFTHPNKQETREMADRYYVFWEKIFHKTPAQTRAEGIDIEKEAMDIIKGNLLLEILTPAIHRICEISYRNKTDVEATLVIISLLRYRQDTGSYPENLEESVTAGYLRKKPMDSFSDKQLVYKKTDDSFLLYSVGNNFEDDGGEIVRNDKGKVIMWADEGDWVLWPIAK